MAIIINLDVMMAKRKKGLTELSKEVDITMANLSVLKNNKLSERVGVTNVNLSKLKTGKVSAVRFSTLNAICRALDCQPGDILAYEPDENSTENK